MAPHQFGAARALATAALAMSVVCVRPSLASAQAPADQTPFIGPAGSYTAHIAGLRLDPAEWVGLKTQYERADKAGQRGVDSLRTQLVFVF